MTTILEEGRYRLIETKRHTKVLYLDRSVYAWKDIGNLSEILVAERRMHKTDCILGEGNYQLYDIQDEPDLSDNIHLELEVGHNNRQGYILPSGLPDSVKPGARITPTTEKITIAPNFALQ